MTQTPVLYTERLILRPMAVSDYADFCEYFLQESVGEFVGCNQGMIAQIFQNNLFAPLTWAMMHNETGKMIGDIHFGAIVDGVVAQIGYVLNNHFQGKGFMTEAVLKVTEFGFDTLGFERIRGILRAANKKSENVLIKCGFQKETFLCGHDFNEKNADLLYYSKMKADCGLV
jgi:ribosomal-protein-alanine N-acetyltransferase